VSWKSPGNLLGWICRHPVRENNLWDNTQKYYEIYAVNCDKAVEE